MVCICLIHNVFNVLLLLYNIIDFSKLLQKVCFVIYILSAQVVIFLEYFFELYALQYILITLFLGFMILPIVKYHRAEVIRIVDKKQLRLAVERDKYLYDFLIYNIFANAICMVGLVSLLFLLVNILVVSVAICILAICLTLIKFIYCRRFYVRKTILYFYELGYILYAIVASSVVPVVCGIYDNPFGNVVLYVSTLLIAYLIFERRHVTNVIKTYFEKKGKGDEV